MCAYKKATRLPRTAQEVVLYYWTLRIEYAKPALSDSDKDYVSGMKVAAAKDASVTIASGAHAAPVHSRQHRARSRAHANSKRAASRGDGPLLWEDAVFTYFRE
eukprot:3226299-Pleurochrysis_carterae.AAC.1